jgi:hypothetical protein
MVGDHRAITFDPDRLDPGPERDPLMGVPIRNRVIVGVEPHQRQGVDPGRNDL